MADTEAKAMLSIREAAEFYCVSDRTIRRYIEAGLLKAQRVGDKTVRIRREDLEALAQPIPAVADRVAS